MDDERMNREANIFARALLMPTDLVQNEIGKRGNRVTSQDIVELAEMFCVEEHQMTLRLIELGFIKVP